MRRKTIYILSAAILVLALSAASLILFASPRLVRMVPVDGGMLMTSETSSEGGVAIRDLYVGKYEVTFKEVADVYNWALQNKRVVVRNDRVYAHPEYLPFTYFMLIDLSVENSSLYYSDEKFQVRPGMERYPAVYVGWFGAAFFCNFLSEREGLTPCYDTIEWTLIEGANGYRLPTFEEWEYLARGGSKTKGFIYAGSNDPYEVSWNKENSDGMTHEVGLKKPNELGLYDMSGNVNEYCTEIFGPLRNAPEGSRLITGYRIWRGGAFNLPPYDISYYVLNANQPEYFLPYPDVGFRVIRDR
jgi:formylglycine-generating enzyme required for sulfatase activity